MKKVLVVLLSFVTFLAVAQHDEQAKEILDKVSAQTKSHKTISVEYVFTHENLEEDPLPICVEEPPVQKDITMVNTTTFSQDDLKAAVERAFAIFLPELIDHVVKELNDPAKKNN